MAKPALSIVVPYTDARTSRLLFLLLRQCQQQKVTDVEIVVVNTTGRSLTDSHNLQTPPAWLSEISECLAPDNLSVPAVRNIGLRSANGEFVCCLDYDDYLHADRLLAQLELCRRRGRPSALRGQLLVDVSGSTRIGVDASQAFPVKSFLREMPAGIPATVMFPRLDPQGSVWQYDVTLSQNTHLEFFARLNATYDGVEVLDNVTTRNASLETHGWLFLSTAIYHGFNVQPAASFFDGAAEVEPTTVSGFAAGLSRLLHAYGFQVT